MKDGLQSRPVRPLRDTLFGLACQRPGSPAKGGSVSPGWHFDSGTFPSPTAREKLLTWRE